MMAMDVFVVTVFACVGVMFVVAMVRQWRAR